MNGILPCLITKQRGTVMDKQHFLHLLEDFSNQRKNHHTDRAASDAGSTVNLAEKTCTEDEKSAFDNLLKTIQKSSLPFI